MIGLDAAGGTAEDLERMIDKPRRIIVEGGPGAAIVYDVEDAEGIQTLLRLEPRRLVGRGVGGRRRARSARGSGSPSATAGGSS